MLGELSLDTMEERMLMVLRGVMLQRGFHGQDFIFHPLDPGGRGWAAGLQLGQSVAQGTEVCVTCIAVRIWFIVIIYRVRRQ